MAISLEEIRTVHFASASLRSLLGPLVAIRSEAERAGLLTIEDCSRGIDHPVLRSLIFLAVNGIDPGELVAFGLGAAVGKDSAEAVRVLFFTLFTVLLQSGEKETEASLRRSLEKKHLVDPSRRLY